MNPRLRPDIVVRKMENPDGAYVVVKDPVIRKYYRFQEWEYDLLAILDGSRDVEELAAEFHARRPEIAFGEQEALDFVEELWTMDLLERTQQERHLVMMDKLKEFRRRRFYDAENSSLFQIHIPLFDPDAMLSRLIGWIRWWWSPWFVVPWAIVFAVVVGFLTYHWRLYWSGFIDLWNLPEKTFLEWVGFFAMMFGVSIWHELGHAFTCKRYGGEVHDIGILIFYLEPAFYCKIDDSYLFQNRWQRVWSVFGGAYFELMLCSTAMAVWLLTPAEWWIHSVASTLVFFTGLSLLAFNMNPLVKLDGYYALMDWIDVPNLREDSFAYIKAAIQRTMFRLEVPKTPASRRRRRIWIVYGILSILYTTGILIALYIILGGWLVGTLGPAGHLVLVGAVAYAFRGKVREMFRFTRHLWLDKKVLLSGPSGWAWGGGALIVLILLVTVPRTPTRLAAAFVVEPARQALVRAPADGIVRRVVVREGDAVAAGDILAVMESPELEAQREEAAAALDLARAQAAAARARGESALRAEYEEQGRQAAERLALLGRRIGSLSLAAPIDGVVTTPYLEERRGAWLAEGEIFCAVDDFTSVRLAVAATETDVEEIRNGTPSRLALTARPGETFRSEVLASSAIAYTPAESEADLVDLVRRASLVRVLVDLPNPDGRLRPGMTGRIQFLTTKRSPAGKVWWRFSRWASSVFW